MNKDIVPDMHITIALAFVAGLVSFAAPCVLPLIPGFLAYLAGTGASEQGSAQRRMIFLNSLCFVLGFSVIFSLLGVVLNTILESVADETQQWLARLGGALIIFFGLYLVGLIRLPWLERKHELKVSKGSRSRYLTSFLFGAAFAAGWTPCVGAVLGSILGLAATQPGSAFALLFSYSLGLGVPFLLVGLFTAPASRFIQRYGKWAHAINVVFGVILIVIGILAFTQRLSLIANFEFLNRILLQ